MKMDRLKHIAQFYKDMSYYRMFYSVNDSDGNTDINFIFENFFLLFIQFSFVLMTCLCSETGTQMCSLKTTVLKFLKFKES